MGLNQPEYVQDECRQALATALREALVAEQPDEAPEPPAAAVMARMLERPPESSMGDYAFPCFRFAKAFRSKPDAVAQKIAASLADRSDWIERLDVVGAFINIHVQQAKVADSCLPAINAGQWFRNLKENSANQQTRVMIEYSQPNTHKEFHVGHARNVCLGNALVRLFRYCGYPVVAANYFGDEGAHIAKCLWWIRKNEVTAPAENRGEWLGTMYAAATRALGDAEGDTKTQYHEEVSAVLAAIESKEGAIYEQWLETRDWSLADFQEIYNWLDVHFDVLFYESEVSEESQAIVDEFLAKGIFVEDDGAVGVDLKASKLGFCILRKRDGNTLYATKDLALARHKFDQHDISRSVYVVGDEQAHHFRQVFKVLDLMGFEQAENCYHLSYGMVTLPDGKMSSRQGTSVTFNSLRQQMLAQVLKILSKYDAEWPAEEIQETAHKLCDGALKYGMTMSDPNKKIVFNMDDWLSFEGNSGPYLMYSYTRVQSILRKAGAASADFTKFDATLLKEPTEHDVLRGLYDFNQVVGLACENYQPSILATHLFDLCKRFNRFYAAVPVLKADSDELRHARMALIAGFAATLGQGLDLLGMRAPERM